MCLDSALQWWLRLLRVFPVSDSESGSVFGLIIGDPDPVIPSRERVVPVCNRDLFPADSPAHCLGAGTPIPFSLLRSWSSSMTAPTTGHQPAASSSPSGQQAQAQTQRQAYHRRKTRAKVKSEALHQKEAAHVEALPVQHPHAAGIDIGSRSHWVCVGFTTEAASC